MSLINYILLLKSIARWVGVSVPDNIVPFSVKLRFNYFYAESEGFQPDSLVLWQSGDEPQWSVIGYITRDASQKYVEKQGLTRLSNFTLYPVRPLPHHLRHHHHLLLRRHPQQAISC